MKQLDKKKKPKKQAGKTAKAAGNPADKWVNRLKLAREQVEESWQSSIRYQRKVGNIQ